MSEKHLGFPDNFMRIFGFERVEVKCDAENNPPEVMEEREIVMDITIKREYSPEELAEMDKENLRQYQASCWSCKCFNLDEGDVFYCSHFKTWMDISEAYEEGCEYKK